MNPALQRALPRRLTSRTRVCAWGAAAHRHRPAINKQAGQSAAHSQRDFVLLLLLNGADLHGGVELLVPHRKAKLWLPAFVRPEPAGRSIGVRGLLHFGLGGDGSDHDRQNRRERFWTAWPRSWPGAKRRAVINRGESAQRYGACRAGRPFYSATKFSQGGKSAADPAFCVRPRIGGMRRCAASPALRGCQTTVFGEPFSLRDMIQGSSTLSRG